MAGNMDVDVGDRFAVVDVETTGLFNLDRIVEIAVVTLDSAGTIIDEYDTLVNPERDVGPTHVHGITASMVAAAPSFEEVAATLAQRLSGAVLVAHNLAFDARMLGNEFSRLEASLVPGKGICTLRLTGERLELACQRYGIALDCHHRALADARATAALLSHQRENTTGCVAAQASKPLGPITTRTLRREGTGEDYSTPLHRILAGIRYPTSDGATLSYLDGLDWVLDDLVITDQERGYLSKLAQELGIDKESQEVAHRAYLQMLINAAVRDNIITGSEHALMTTVADALGITDITIPVRTELPTTPSSISSGTRVCFTGSAVDPTGRKIDRAKLEAFASLAGLQPVRSVSRKGCDLVVASDAASASSKAVKARKYEIPIISVETFLAQVDAW